MGTINNWINSKSKDTLSSSDKLKLLLKIGHKLVLVQKHELERIRKIKHTDSYAEYINDLYKHYIILGMPKTYLCNL